MHTVLATFQNPHIFEEKILVTLVSSPPWKFCLVARTRTTILISFFYHWDEVWSFPICFSLFDKNFLNCSLFQVMLSSLQISVFMNVRDLIGSTWIVLRGNLSTFISSFFIFFSLQHQFAGQNYFVTGAGYQT